MRARGLSLGVALSAVVALAGCGLTDDGLGSGTLPPLGPATGTLAGPGVTADPGVVPLIDTGPRSPRIVGDGCALTKPAGASAPATVTYLLGTSLFELSADAETAKCLMTMPESATTLLPLWAPTGDRFLLGPKTVMIGGKLAVSGLQADAVTASWSTPDGEFFAAITNDNRLVRRPVDGSKKLANISFLKHTTAVAYHPSGSVLFAAGTNKDGSVELALSEPAGKLFRPLVLLPDSAEVTEVVASADGQSIGFIETTANSTLVRVLTMPELTLSTRIEATTPVSRLVHDADVVAVRIGECSGSTSTRLSTESTTADLNAGEPFVGRSTEPIGFIAGSLIVASRQTGCTGPADVWAVDPADPSVPTLLISGVNEPSIRPSAPAHGDLPEGMKQEPVQG